MNIKNIKKEAILKKRNRRGAAWKKPSRKEIEIIAKKRIEDKNKLLALKRGDKKLEAIEERVEEAPEEKGEILSGLDLFNAAVEEENAYNKKMAAAGLNYHAVGDIFLLSDEEVRKIYEGYKLTNDIMDKYNYYKDEFDLEILSKREVENLPFLNIDDLKDLRSAFYTKNTEGTEGSEGREGREGSEGSEGREGREGCEGCEGSEGREGTKPGPAEIKEQESEKEDVKDKIKDEMKDRMKMKVKMKMKDNLHIKP